MSSCVLSASVSLVEASRYIYDTVGLKITLMGVFKFLFGRRGHAPSVSSMSLFLYRAQTFFSLY